MEVSKLKENRTFPIVIVGHIDHGKSTLIGSLLYHTGSLPAEKVQEVEESLKKVDKQFEFAHLIDYLEEERLNEMTIDTSQVFFSTDKRRYVIIDVPGHKEFIKNMITGSSQANAALLLVDVAKGVEEQTKRHVYVLKLLGLTQVCVLVNKMDQVGYSEQRFGETKDSVQSLFSRMGTSFLSVIPVSAYNGDNIASSSGKMNWYTGPTVVETIDSMSGFAEEAKPLRFPVQDIYNFNGHNIIAGRVEAGRLEVGQEIDVLPGSQKATIAIIEKYLGKDIQSASTGECVGLILEEEINVERGQVLIEHGSMSSPAIGKFINANIFWMVDEKYSLNDSLTFKCSTQEIPCNIKTIKKLYDPAFEKIEENPSVISIAEVAEVEIDLEKPAIVDKFNEFAETGRFVLEQSDQPVAGGIIL